MNITAFQDYVNSNNTQTDEKNNTLFMDVAKESVQSFTSTKSKFHFYDSEPFFIFEINLEFFSISILNWMKENNLWLHIGK